jgi:hypothetical protein
MVMRGIANRYSDGLLAVVGFGCYVGEVFVRPGLARYLALFGPIPVFWPHCS